WAPPRAGSHSTPPGSAEEGDSATAAMLSGGPAAKVARPRAPAWTRWQDVRRRADRRGRRGGGGGGGGTGGRCGGGRRWGGRAAGAAATRAPHASSAVRAGAVR